MIEGLIFCGWVILALSGATLLALNTTVGLITVVIIMLPVYVMFVAITLLYVKHSQAMQVKNDEH